MKRIYLKPEIKDQLKSDLFLSEIELKGSHYNLLQVIGEGYKSVVRLAKDQYGSPRAVKFAVYEDYLDKSVLSEAYLAKRLESATEKFAEFIDVEIKEITLPDGSKEKFAIFITKYVEGKNLEDYLTSNEHLISCDFLYQFAIQACEILNILKSEKLVHDDLHAKNIMIEAPHKGSLNQDSLNLKVIDTGSIKKNETIEKLEQEGKRPDYKISDLDNIINCIILIHNRILQENRSKLTRAGRKFLAGVEQLLGLMSEEDPNMQLDDPEAINKQFNLAYEKAYYPVHTDSKLRDPFDYISAEHIQDDKLLSDLFSNKCPWWKKVSSPDPINLYGPRGCGKSTVFRMLRLKTFLHKDFDFILNQPIIGFYLSCSSDLRNRFALIDEKASLRFQKEIVQYFNLILCYEIADTIRKINRRGDKDKFGINYNLEREFCLFILQKLNRSIDFLNRLKGISPIEQLCQIILIMLDETYKSILLGSYLEFSSPPSFLAEVTTFLKAKINFFASKQIAFLIDDLSKHRIPEHIQKILNLVIWDRQASHIFKVSSEVRGVVYGDILDSTAEESREYQIIDCGTEFINLTDSDLGAARAFAVEILNRRLEAAGYIGRAEGLIGESEFQDGLTLSWALYRAEQDKTYPKKVHYHGLDIITGICSGDISAMLDIYRAIFNAALINKTSTKKVDKSVQHKAITAVSSVYFNKIKDYHPFGREMQDIVNNFGWLSRNLVRSKLIAKGSGRREPWSLIRIEIEMKDWGRIQGKEFDKLAELIRRTVLIELNPGRSLKSNTTLRLHLRRIYAPQFNIALVHTAPLRQTEEDLLLMLNEPKTWYELEWGKRNGNNQEKLFND